LKAEFDIPSELENAKLPAMILQPVIENAIKYGVSQSRDKVTLRIAAREAGPGRFTIEIVNSGNIEPSTKRGDHPDGVGVGLTNVCQRLTARFGPAAQCEFGPVAEGGYRVVLTLPLANPFSPTDRETTTRPVGSIRRSSPPREERAAPTRDSIARRMRCARC
jgi:LytS/YehU family sensor histidine kinase